MSSLEGLLIDAAVGGNSGIGILYLNRFGYLLKAHTAKPRLADDKLAVPFRNEAVRESSEQYLNGDVLCYTN